MEYEYVITPYSGAISAVQMISTHIRDVWMPKDKDDKKLWCIIFANFERIGFDGIKNTKMTELSIMTRIYIQMKGNDYYET